jgi:hypothetical protein
MAKLKVIKKEGYKPIKFKEGGLHATLHVKKDEKIPEGKMKAAKEGDYGPKAQKQAIFAANILTGRKK